VSFSAIGRFVLDKLLNEKEMLAEKGRCEQRAGARGRLAAAIIGRNGALAARRCWNIHIGRIMLDFKLK
jgi:hypothetical protein